MIAAARSCEPRRLKRQLQGELDWIVLKAMERDRERRYESANGLAQDVRRYLNHEAVEACPPSGLYRLRKFSRKHWRLLGGAGLLLLTMVAGLFFSSWQAVRAMRAEQAAIEARNAAEFEHVQRLIQERKQLLGEGLRRSLGTLSSIAATVETWPDLSRAEFAHFTQRCLAQHPEISSFTWVPRIAGDQRARVEAAVQAEGFDDFQFRELDEDGGFSGRSARPMAEYLPILYVEPLEPNRMILGMDSSSNPPRKRTLDQARDRGGMVASAPLLLGEEQSGQLGFLVFHPVYQRSGDNPLDRQNALVGFAVAAFRIPDLVDGVLGDLANQEIALRIFDLENLDRPIYQSERVPPSRPLFRQTHDLDIAGRCWRLNFATYRGAD